MDAPESFHIFSLWDKKNNPEPWNQLDPTYQYKVTHFQSNTEGLQKSAHPKRARRTKRAASHRGTEKPTVVTGLEKQGRTVEPK